MQRSSIRLLILLFFLTGVILMWFHIQKWLDTIQIEKYNHVPYGEAIKANVGNDKNDTSYSEVIQRLHLFYTIQE